MTRRNRLADLLTGGALTRARADVAHHRRAQVATEVSLGAERTRHEETRQRATRARTDATRAQGALTAVHELLDADGTTRTGATASRVHAALEAARAPHARSGPDAVTLAGALLHRFRCSTVARGPAGVPVGHWGASCSQAQYDEWCSKLDALSRGTAPLGPEQG